MYCSEVSKLWKADSDDSVDSDESDVTSEPSVSSEPSATDAGCAVCISS